jgi:probable DNA repair protein
VPSRQRAEALRQRLARTALGAGLRVWPTPDILPQDFWLSREIEAAAATDSLPRLLSSAQDWLLWRQCAGEFTDGLELVARGALAEALRRANELATEYSIPARDLANPAGTEGRLLYEVRRAVHARYAAEGVTTLRTLAGELGCVGDARAVEFAGYLSLPPFLRAIIAARQARGYATRTRKVALPEPRARRIVAADRDEELARIVAWCHAHLDARPEARTLVVLPGPADLRERLLALLQQSLDPRRALFGAQDSGAGDALVAIEGGESLARAPLVAHALTGLAVLTRTTQFDALSAWLCAPYWRQADAAGRARLDLWLRSGAPIELDLPALLMLLAEVAPERDAASRSAARDLSARLSAARAYLEARSGTPREWAVRIRDALNALHWPGDAPRNSDAEQTLKRFNELLDEFGELGVAARSLSRDNALQTFNELATRTKFRPASGDALVTVTSNFEDPIVQYDGIWVAGLDAGTWPQPVQINPFLSVAAQRAAGVPAASAQGRTAHARALMSAWRAAAIDLVFSVAAREEDLELMPSPLLGEWASAANPLPPPAVWLPARLRREGALESLTDASGPLWPTSELLPSGTRLLELQSLCAFRAFAELRLNSRALEAPEPGVPAMVRGQFLHAALEALWGRLKDSQSLQRLPADGLKRLIEDVVAHAAQRLWGTTNTRAQTRERARAQLLLNAVCDLERQRAPFRVRDIERNASVALAGAQLNLRIDRVDELEDGALVILDYKSGTHKKMDWYGEHLSHPQLLAYLAALDESVRAVATVNVAAREVGFHGIAAVANLLPKLAVATAQEGMDGSDLWTQSRHLWRTRIAALVRDFLSGHAAVDPAPKACLHCDVASLCRIADRAVPIDEEASVGAEDE